MALNFEDLIVWQNAHKLVLEIYKISAKFPPNESYSLADQLRRSALSVSANIAEAHGRYHYLDKVKFLFNARGSIEETRNHLIVAKDLNYIKETEFDILNTQYKGLVMGLNKFISSIRNKSIS
jgi:four helix bundle protein